MPLKPGSDKETISGNISEFHGGKTYASTEAKFGKNKANKQAVAVAYSKAREGHSNKGDSKSSKGKKAGKGVFRAVGNWT